MTELDLQSLPPMTDSSVFSDTFETPSWLLTPATGVGPPPPVDTRMQLLPFSELSWEHFERLCLRILRNEVGSVRASLYGRPGQAQYGIDMYAIAPTEAGKSADPRGYVTLQSRRISDITATNIESSVNDFLQDKWADVTQTFIYATSSPIRSNQVLDKIEKLAGQLDSPAITHSQRVHRSPFLKRPLRPVRLPAQRPNRNACITPRRANAQSPRADSNCRHSVPNSTPPHHPVTV